MEIKLDKDLSKYLVDLCEEYKVDLKEVEKLINQNNTNCKETDRHIIEKQIEIDKNDLKIFSKNDSNKNLFKKTIASLIFYKYKLANL